MKEGTKAVQVQDPVTPPRPSAEETCGDTSFEKQRGRENVWVISLAHVVPISTGSPPAPPPPSRPAARSRRQGRRGGGQTNRQRWRGRRGPAPPPSGGHGEGVRRGDVPGRPARALCPLQRSQGVAEVVAVHGVTRPCSLAAPPPPQAQVAWALQGLCPPSDGVPPPPPHALQHAAVRHLGSVAVAGPPNDPPDPQKQWPGGTRDGARSHAPRRARTHTPLPRAALPCALRFALQPRY